VREIGKDATKPPLYGIYDVEDFRKNNLVSLPLLSDSLRWKRVVFGFRNRWTLRTMSDSVLLYRSKVDTLTHSLALTIRTAPELNLTLGFEQPDSQRIVLRGVVKGDSLTVRLRRVDQTKYLLLSRGFHWIQEKPFNR